MAENIFSSVLGWMFGSSRSRADKERDEQERELAEHYAKMEKLRLACRWIVTHHLPGLTPVRWIATYEPAVEGASLRFRVDDDFSYKVVRIAGTYTVEFVEPVQVGDEWRPGVL